MQDAERVQLPSHSDTRAARAPDDAEARGDGRRDDWIVVVLAAAVGCLSFFDRAVMFGDEIINTYRAQEQLLFNYADRPAYYLMNVVAVDLLGAAPASLVALSLVLFVLTALLLARLGRHLAGGAGGLWSGAFFALSPLVYRVGIRGMPHLPAGTVTLVPVLVLLWAYRSGSGRRRDGRSFAAGVLAALTLAFHPILVAFVAAFGAWLLLGAALPRLTPSSGLAARLSRRSHLWAMAGMAAGGLLLELIFQVVGGRSYVRDMLAGADRIGVERDPRTYLEYLLYYLRLIADALPSGVVLGALGVVAVGVVVVLRRRWPDAARLQGWSLSLCLLLGSIAVLPVAQLRAERVFVTFVPLVSLFLGVSATLGWDLLPTAWRRRERRLAAVGLVVALLLAVPVLAPEVAAVRRERSDDRHGSGWTWFYELVRGVDADKVGFIGAPRQNIQVHRILVLGGKPWQRLGRVFPSEPGRIRQLRRRLIRDQVVYLVVDARGPDAARTEAVLRGWGGDRLATWKATRQFWRLELLEDRPLIAHWPLEPDLRFRDTGPFALHGVGSGDPVWRSRDEEGSCLAFTGGSKRVVLPLPEQLLPGDRFAIEMWVRPGEPARPRRQTLIGRRGQLTIALDRGRPAVLLRGLRPARWHVAPRPLAPERWQSLRVGLDRGVVRIELDGETVYRRRVKGTLQRSAAPLSLGHTALRACVDEVRILRPPATKRRSRRDEPATPGRRPPSTPARAAPAER